MNNADVMREKQRRADLKKQGIDPDAEETNQPTKQYDTSYLDQYNVEDGEEEKKEEAEEPVSAAAAATQIANEAKGGKKKGKNK